MNPKLMICVAPLGAFATKADNPATPITPKEIADDVVACAAAGASIAHVHARDADGKPTQEPVVYREIVERIRERSDIVIQLSIGTRGFAIDDALRPIELKPEMASFPLRAVRADAEGDPYEDLEYMARRMTAAGVRPELDGSTEDMLRAALVIRERGALVDPLCFGLVVKDPDSAHEAADKLLAFSAIVPEGAHWWVAKGGPHQLLVRSLAIGLGGHVRVGFEDSTLDFAGTGPAPSNAWLVARIADLGQRLGREPASPAEVRSLLSLNNTPV